MRPTLPGVAADRGTRGIRHVRCADQGGLPDLGTAELPAPPASTWRIIGPGAVAAGVGLASGEFVLYPYIASQVGLVFVWAAAVGLATQYFINMEIERYTLATGETVLTGFSRLGRHWGLVFVAARLARQSLAGLGDQRGDPHHLSGRRQRALDRDRDAGRDRPDPDAVAGRLSLARARAVR